MKKLFLFVAVGVFAFSLNSCSSSDGGGSSAGGTVTTKINGVAKTFNVAVVNEDVYDAGTPDEYTELTVTATIGTSTTEIISFYLDKGDVGADAIYGFNYVKDGVGYYGSGVVTNVTTNNNSKKLIGNFSGTCTDGTTTFTFADGAFNIQY